MHVQLNAEVAVQIWRRNSIRRYKI